MAVLTWDTVGERLFEAGVKKMVLFPQNADGTYGAGVAWSGVTKVTEKPDGAEAKAMYADDIKYASPRSKEEFKATIEAYMYPDEFAECCGEKELVSGTGVTVGQQKHKPFAFSYVTTIGSDTEDYSHGYKIHIVYGATAAPVEKAYETINDNPDAMTFSWDIETVPVEVTGCEPTSIVTIPVESNATQAYKNKVSAIEALLYGTENAAASLPLPDDVKTELTRT